MFSFRTTSLEEQFDKALQEGKVGCFCTQNCWDTQRGRYMYDIFRERGNLQVIFMPRDTELTPHTNHVEFTKEDLQELNAVVVEIQDVGNSGGGCNDDINIVKKKPRRGDITQAGV